MQLKKIPDDFWHLNVELTSKNDREEIEIRSPYKVADAGDFIEVDGDLLTNGRVGVVYQYGQPCCGFGIDHIAHAWLIPPDVEDPAMWVKATNNTWRLRLSYED